MKRVRIRNLPPTSTIESVEELLNSSLGSTIKDEKIEIVRVTQGKPGTSTKPMNPATAYLNIPNEQMALKISKKLAPSNFLLDFAPFQVLVIPKPDKNPEADTWKSHPEYQKYLQTVSVKEDAPSLTSSDSVKVNATPSPPPPQTQTPPAASSALVAHMRKELLNAKLRSEAAGKSKSSRRYTEQDRKRKADAMRRKQ